MAQVTTAPPSVAFPSRYRAQEQRGRRLGKVLARLAHVQHVDDDLMREIGIGFTRVDEVGARLAAAITARGPGRVSQAQFQAALRDGVQEDTPGPIRDFLAAVTPEPDWVDWDVINEGARVYRRLGRNAGDVLLQLSLIGGYRFGGPTDLLVATGGLVGDMTRRRLAETQHWTMLVTEHDALRPGAPGWCSTLHVRLMHAMVNRRFAGDPAWDTDRWGEPINKSDQASTLCLFSGTVLIGVRALGVPVSDADAAAIMQLWRYVGWLMGVDQQWLFAGEREQYAFSYHLLLAQDGQTEAGRQLSQSIVAIQPDLDFERWPAWQRVYAPRRLLSMMTLFLGPASMRELGLPVRVPWAFAMAVAGNTWRYRVRGRGATGRDRLERWGNDYRRRLMRRYNGPGPAGVAPLPAN